MNTPVLTKKQQKQSLSAKKKPIKGLRNVLAQPHITYWPVVNLSDDEKLNSFLGKLLPVLKRPFVRVKKKKKLSKQDTQSKEESTKPNASLPKINSVVLGINTVTRSLEKNEVCCVLLDATVEPPLLIKHIIMMAHNKKIPVLLLHYLKNLTMKHIGFPCSALGLKHEVLSPDHQFYTLYDNVLSISKNYPPKQALPLITSDKSFDSTVSQDSETDDKKCDENTLNVNEELDLLTNIYKVRSSCKERVFIPPSEAKTLNDEKGADFIPLNNDFISFNNDMDVNDNEDVQHTRKTRYFKPCIKQNTGQQNPPNKKPNHTNKNSTLSGHSENSRMKNKNNKLPAVIPKNSKRNDVNYLPLKIKRLRGNINRVKATKVSKKKKKNQHK